MALMGAAFYCAPQFKVLRWWLHFQVPADECDSKDFKSDTLEIRKSQVSLPPKYADVDPGRGLFTTAPIKKGARLVSFPGFWVHRVCMLECEKQGWYCFDMPEPATGSAPAAEELADGNWPTEFRVHLAYGTYPQCQANAIQSAIYKDVAVAEANVHAIVCHPTPPAEWKGEPSAEGLVLLTAARDIAPEEVVTHTHACHQPPYVGYTVLPACRAVVGAVHRLRTHVLVAVAVGEEASPSAGVCPSCQAAGDRVCRGVGWVQFVWRVRVAVPLGTRNRVAVVWRYGDRRIAGALATPSNSLHSC